MALLTRFLFLSLLFAVPVLRAHAQPAPFTLYLVGDGGASYSVESTPALAMLRDSLDACPGTCSVLFLGDNLYESGLAPPGHPDRARGEQIMDTQIESARGASGHVIFVPGNHDSGSIGVGGDFERLLEMQRYVEARLSETSFLPADGSPGPVVVDAAPGVALVFINSQWWFEADHRGEATGHIASPHRKEVVARLDSVFTALGDRHIVLASHHPIRSPGGHAMYWPVRPTFTGVIKRVVGSPQDFDERDYEVYRNDIGRLLERHPDVILAAGHDHVLAYLADGAGHHIVSGSISKLDWVSQRAGAHYASALPGMAVLRYHPDGRVQLTFAVTENDRRQMQFDEIILRKDISRTRANIDLANWQIDPNPPPNLGFDAAPTFTPDRGPGVEASIRWTVPDSPLRKARRVMLHARYDHDLEMIGVRAEASQRQTGWRYFLRGAFVHANRFDLFRGARQYPQQGAERLLRYQHASAEIGLTRLGYDDLVRVGFRTEFRLDDVSPLARPTVAGHEQGTDVSATAHGLFEVNTLDSHIMPRGGAALSIRGGVSTAEHGRGHATGSVDARLFRSIGFERPFTIGILTAGRAYRGNDAFYLRHYLGDGDGLRGYEEWRFTGDRVVTASLEGRATLAHLDGTRALRPLGLLGFVDGGLVRTDPRDAVDWPSRSFVTLLDVVPAPSSRWHSRGAAGFGIWANTSARVVLNATAAYGAEGWRLTLAPRFAF